MDCYKHMDVDNYNHIDIDNYNHVDIDNYKHINKESYNDTYNYYKELRTRHNSYNNIQSDDHYDNNLKRVDTNNEVLLLSNDILKYDLTNDNNIDKNKTNSYNDMKKKEMIVLVMITITIMIIMITFIFLLIRVIIIF